MKSSRLAAAGAALAIGFGVTLAGVVIGDDDAVDSIQTAENDDLEGAEQEENVAEEPDEAEVADPEGPRDEPPDEPLADEPPPDPADAETATTVESQPASTVPQPAPTTPVISPDELDEILCVDTISVVFDSGDRADLVVEASEGAAAWRVLDADGTFIISLDDDGVIEVVEVLRNVRFFQGAPVNFFDVCDEVGSSQADESSSGSGSASGDNVAQATANFPCSDAAQAALRQTLDGDEIAQLDDVGELQLVLARRLDDLGGRDTESWRAALVDELNAFRVFDDGCPPALDAGFTREGIFCAAANVSVDDALLQFFETVVPQLMVGCTYISDGDGAS